MLEVRFPRGTSLHEVLFSMRLSKIFAVQEVRSPRGSLSKRFSLHEVPLSMRLARYMACSPRGFPLQEDVQEVLSPQGSALLEAYSLRCSLSTRISKRLALHEVPLSTKLFRYQVRSPRGLLSKRIVLQEVHTARKSL